MRKKFIIPELKYKARNPLDLPLKLVLKWYLWAMKDKNNQL